MQILEKKINNINQPPNRDKLEKPFHILNIHISEEDSKAINHRNNFLHGRKITRGKKPEDFLKVYEISLRLNNLVNKLILKHIGFSGHMINQVKHNEKMLGYKVEKDLFEKI